MRIRFHHTTIAIVYFGIGSNIDAEENMMRCAELLRSFWPDIRFSSVYKTAPREVEQQDDFLNAVAVIETEESVMMIQTHLEQIETTLKKSTPYQFGPRTIDLDILLYDNELIEEDDLMIPHPRMHERRFVLEPLMELVDPNAEHPVLGESWQSLLDTTMDQECEKSELKLRKH